MNQIFCFKRYTWLVKSQWFENAAIYKWGIALMALLVGAMFGFFLWMSRKEGVAIPESFLTGQLATFCLTGVLFLYIFGANFFSSLTSKDKKMFFFSLPVTPLERVAVAFTFVLAFMPILILTVFNVFDFIAVQIFNHLHDISGQMLLRTRAPMDALSQNPVIVNVLAQLSCVSVFVLGSLMFGKKGPVVSLIFLIVVLVAFQWLRNTFFYTVNSTFILEHIENYVYIYLLPICWTAIYFVMKRKEA